MWLNGRIYGMLVENKAKEVGGGQEKEPIMPCLEALK